MRSCGCGGRSSRESGGQGGRVGGQGGEKAGSKTNLLLHDGAPPAPLCACSLTFSPPPPCRSAQRQNISVISYVATAVDMTDVAGVVQSIVRLLREVRPRWGEEDGGRGALS